MALLLCATCARHVRSSDPECPFCGSTREAPLPVPLSRATRAALVFGSATMVIAGVACGGSVDTSDGGSGESDAASTATATATSTSTVTPVPPYGAPPPRDAGEDSSPVAMYGAPPPDASAVPAYGLPAPDAGGD